MSFQTRLKDLRKSKGLTQKQLAINCGLSERNIQGFEYGEKKPAFESLIKLANALEVSIDYLTDRTDNPEINE